MNMDEARVAALYLIGRSEFLTLSALDEAGFPESRRMFNLRKKRSEAFSAGASLANVFSTYIGTNTSSRKVAEFRRDDRACLYYHDDERYEGLSVTGRIGEVFDPEVRKALWDPSWEIYYPGGIDGGDFTLLRFFPGTARFYHGLGVAEIDCHEER